MRHLLLRVEWAEISIGTVRETCKELASLSRSKITVTHQMVNTKAYLGLVVPG
jgi:hypothetical protein